MRNPLNLCQSLLALALALGAATTAFAAQPAKLSSPPAATTTAPAAKTSPATTTMAAPVPVASRAAARTASHRMANAKSHKRCEQRNKIGHCTKWAASKPAKPARNV